MRAIISAVAALKVAGGRCSREAGADRNDKLVLGIRFTTT